MRGGSAGPDDVATRLVQLLMDTFDSVDRDYLRKLEMGASAVAAAEAPASPRSPGAPTGPSRVARPGTPRLVPCAHVRALRVWIDAVTRARARRGRARGGQASG